MYRVLGFLTIVLFATQGVGLSSPISFGPEVSKKLGSLSFSGLDTGSTVYSYDVRWDYSYNLRGQIQNPSKFGFVFRSPVADLGPVLSTSEKSELLNFVSEDNNFVFSEVQCKCCYIEPEYAFLFVSEAGDSTAVLLSQRCESVYLQTNKGTVILIVDPSASRLWEFPKRLFPFTEVFEGSGRKISPVPKQKYPPGHIEPRKASGRSISSLEPNETLEIVLGRNIGYGPGVYRFIVIVENGVVLVKPGSVNPEEPGWRPPFQLSKEQIQALDLAFENSRWDNVSPVFGPNTLELIWTRKSRETTTESYIWPEARGEGFPDFEVLYQAWDSWKEEK